MARLWLILLLLLALSTNGEAAEGIADEAVVVDGDTLRLGSETVRLHGIDAPESGQTCTNPSGASYDCGAAATRALTLLLRDGTVHCTGRERDRYGRLIALCHAGGTELNDAMVASGWAVAFRRYSDAHIATETRAARSRNGLWAGGFTPPWEWRQREAATGGEPALLSLSVAEPSADCTIKGNISGRGRIYHLPGSAHYARTTISEAKGERWFCSGGEARAAGWRPVGG